MERFGGHIAEFESGAPLELATATTLRQMYGAYVLVSLDCPIYFNIGESSGWNHEQSGGVVSTGGTRELWFSANTVFSYYVDSTGVADAIGGRLEKWRLVPDSEIDGEEELHR